jgi:hypothetical protein
VQPSNSQCCGDIAQISISIQFIADYSVAEPELDIKTVIAMVIRGLMQ